MMKRAFTLMEVNLAMFVMAVGTLGLVGLYSFGYREGQQSNEDVQAAAVAEAHLSAMITALSSTNMTWSSWLAIGNQPSEGWGKYANDGTNAGIGDDDGTGVGTPLNREGCNSAARTAFGAVMQAAGYSAAFSPGDMTLGIVVTRSGDDRTYAVAVRCAKRAGSLLAQPLYYSEVCFQGLRRD